MRRFLVFFVFMVALSQLNVFSQTTDDSRPMWGIKAALDVNLPGKWSAGGDKVDMYRHGFGGAVGAVYNIYLGHDFYIEPGLSLFYDAYSYKKLYVAENSQPIDPTIYKSGFRLPVVAGYSFDFTDRYGMSVYTGPELSYVFSGGIRGKYVTPDNEDIGEALNPYAKHGMFRRFDCAWKIGVAFPTDYVTLNIDAAIGITDICKHDISMRENRISIGLAHYF